MFSGMAFLLWFPFFIAYLFLSSVSRDAEASANRNTPLKNQDCPRRLGRPPGTGHLQRVPMLSETHRPEKRPIGCPLKLKMVHKLVAPVDLGPFNLVRFKSIQINLHILTAPMGCPEVAMNNMVCTYNMGIFWVGVKHPMSIRTPAASW